MPPQTSIWFAAQSGNLKKRSLMDFLDQDPTLLDREDESGITPLGYAVQCGKPSVVSLLLESGADPDKKLGKTAQFPDGRTPVYLAATATPPNRRIVQLLLEKRPKSFDEPIRTQLYKNETPLMTVIVQSGDPEIVKLLVNEGASLEAKNADGKTAHDLADQLSDESKKIKIKEALEPNLKKGGGGGLRAYISNWVLGVLSYFKSWKILGTIFKSASQYFYKISSPPRSDPDKDHDVEEPKNAADFKNILDGVVKKEGLDRFFPPGNTFMDEVAAKAEALKNDPKNLLNSPTQLRGLATLALYQPVIYCDDSGSMKEKDGKKQENRWRKQAELVKRMTNVTNRAVPDNKGVHVRFINTDTPDADNLHGDAVALKLNFTPSGSTPIGTKLKERILNPFIYSSINAGRPLERPYLILIITDGCPQDESEDQLRNSIVDCSRFLAANGYRKDVVRFCISQIGRDNNAKEFMDRLDVDEEVLEVLHRTAELIDERYDKLKKNEATLENWLLEILLSPIQSLNS